MSNSDEELEEPGHQAIVRKRSGKRSFAQQIEGLTSPERAIAMASVSSQLRAQRQKATPARRQLTTEQQLAKQGYDDSMKEQGVYVTEKDANKDIRRYVCDTLFKKIKFIFDKDLVEDGRVAKAIKDQVLHWKQAEFTKAWVTWMGQHVRTSVNEKRGGVNQLMATTVWKCKSCTIQLYISSSLRHINITFISYATDQWGQANARKSSVVQPTDIDFRTVLTGMRTNMEKYAWFYDNVLSCVVGKHYWKKHCHEANGCAMANNGDEALALLLLDNSWDLWKQKANRKLDLRKKGRTMSDGQSEDELEITQAPEETTTTQSQQKKRGRNYGTKYTTANGGMDSLIGGWTVEGINQYTRYTKQVAKSRKDKEGKIFDKWYRARKLLEFKGKVQRKKCGPESKRDLAIDYPTNDWSDNDGGDEEGTDEAEGADEAVAGMMNLSETV
jgi:hypothetical protein